MAQKFEFERQINQEPITVKGPDGQDIEAILGIWRVEKTFNGETKISHFVTVGNTPDGVFKDSNVRLYLPLRGSYDPSDKELLELFEGKRVYLQGLTKKDGGTYNGVFLFDPWASRSFTDRFGKVQTPNFTGNLDFAPRDYDKK